MLWRPLHTGPGAPSSSPIGRLGLEMITLFWPYVVLGIPPRPSKHFPTEPPPELGSSLFKSRSYDIPYDISTPTPQAGLPAPFTSPYCPCALPSRPLWNCRIYFILRITRRSLKAGPHGRQMTAPLSAALEDCHGTIACTKLHHP